MAEKKFQGTNITNVKLHNQQVVLLSLLYEGSLSRVQLAKKADLSNTTITNLVGELIQEGILSEDGGYELEPNVLRPVGRPRTGVHLVPYSRYAVGVHIGVGLFRIAITNLYDESLINQIYTFDINEPAEIVLVQIVEKIESIISESGVGHNKILGVGVGASGLVDARSKINILAPNLNWHNVPIQEYIQNAVNLPVVVDNNVHAMAIGETYFGAARGVDSMAFVYGRTGVGAGLIFRGQVFRGSTTGAGEIGHMILLMRGGEPCRCGNSGCLETLVSEPIILRQAENIARRNPKGILAKTINERQDLTLLDRVFTAARSGDEEVHRMIDERAYYLGLALSNLVNLFNPELILLGGIFAQGKDLFLEPVIRTVRETAFGGLGEKVRVEPTSFGWRAGVLGAAALALVYFFYQQE
jgi:glucokinase-like ROK family protein